MRRVTLGLLATVFLAGPLLAQNPFGSTVARRSTEAPRNVAPAQYRVVKSTRVQEVIADHGYGEAAPCGCNQCGSLSGRGRGGTGLGLAIARGFVEANGGRVWSEQAPGSGAAFVVAVPAEQRPLRLAL